MTACPWCSAAVKDAAEPCTNCGRRAADHPSQGGGGVGGGSDVPDLVVPTRHAKVAAPPAAPKAAARPAAAKPKQAATAPAAPARTSGEHGGGPLDDVFDDEPDAMKLDLDLDNGPPMMIAPPSGRMPVAGQPAAPPAPKAASTILKDGSDAGQAKTPEAAAVAVDPFEARALADYGAPPKGWWLTPLYAYRVITRRMELKRQLVLKKEEAARAEEAAEIALVAFAERARPLAQGQSAFARQLEEVRMAEELFVARDGALATEVEAQKQMAAEFDRRVAEVEVEVKKVKDVEAGILAELAQVDTILKRAEARVKRVEIEVRNAQQQHAAISQPQGPKAQ